MAPGHFGLGPARTGIGERLGLTEETVDGNVPLILSKFAGSRLRTSAASWPTSPDSAEPERITTRSGGPGASQTGDRHLRRRWMRPTG